MSLIRRILGHVTGAGQQDAAAPITPAYSRSDMDAALKAVVVPHLRSMGFKGSLPQFHRQRGEAVDLLAFQFLSGGGAFIVEIGRVSPEGLTMHGRHVPVAKAKTYHLRERHRLGSELRVNWGDHWFQFANVDPNEVARHVCVELDRPEVWALVDTMPLPA